MPSVVRYVYAWASSPVAAISSGVFFVRRGDAERYQKKVGHGVVLRVYTQNLIDGKGNFTPDQAIKILKLPQEEVAS